MVTEVRPIGKGGRSLPGRLDLPRFPKRCDWCGVIFDGLPEQRYHATPCKRRAAYDRVKRRKAVAR